MLKNSSLEDIKALENITNSIVISYQKIYALELENLKDSEEFKKALEDLKSSIFIEKSILSRIASSSEFESIVKYVEKRYDGNIGIVFNISRKNKDKVKARILNNLNSAKINRDCKLSKDEFPSSLYVVNFYNDIIKLALTLFKFNKHGINVADISEMKYIISVTNPKLEEELVESNFSISASPFLASDLLIINESEKNVANLIKEIESTSLYNAYITDILRTDVNILNDPVSFKKIIFNSCILRSTFVLSNSLYDSARAKSDYVIENLKKYPSAKIALELYLEIVSSYENDKKVPQYLSFMR